ncbi:hypothetical protein O181_012278 [Austropuccinia psidii MF-1]|uniref:Uncharacterized protein n=1 Tax=Austropuccinia psidii MF-1 TaxID=1389203 RepID=A0A9Q3BWH6_9BASI|nr:hypothetical protein [Austropuccinia psidii MF-1]
MPREYDGNSHTQCQLFTPTSPTSNSAPPSYPDLFSWTSNQKLIQLPSGSDLPTMTPPNSMIQTFLIKKPDFIFSGIEKSPMENQPIIFGPPHPLDQHFIPGT